MTSPNTDISISDPGAFQAVLDSLAAVKGGVKTDGLSQVLGASDGSDTAGSVAAILSKVQANVTRSDTAVAGIISDLEAFRTEVTGIDRKGKDEVLRA
ncbi:hypothetical protein [Mycolicibacterium farcinogenes]|uniref:Uncharacterized protein n=1 Tax=Mycolicibacterium farcinogenes TaxID=1802 RepID=A0ACD1FI72_MYCFR|nr:hypothetical protein [Mycolicibacterium farcinogenes]QZH66734.1 hypothetical protein K6L26_03305 [Mycolicibacterium farcinogenes]